MAITNVSSSTRVEAGTGSGTSYRSAFAMVTTLFFMWGFLTSLNDILIPHFKDIFGLTYSQVANIQVAFFFAYAIFGFPAGKIVEWIGYQRTMVAGLFTMAVGAVLFIPAANLPSFALFLVALIILGAGMSALQVAANPYVAVLGPPQTASSRLNLSQAFNSLGTTIGPPLGGYLILRGTTKIIENTSSMTAEALRSYQQQQAASVKFPYFIFALVLVLLGLAIALYKFPRIETTKDFRPIKGGGKQNSIWRYPHVVLGALAIFLYVGAEVSIGSFLINYFHQSYIAALTELAASAYVAFYWGGAMVGRFIGSALLQKIKTGHLLSICAVVAMLLVIVSMSTSFTSGAVSNIHLNLLLWKGALIFPHSWPMWSILAVGLFNSIMFPSIFTLGIAEMGPLTGEASGLLVIAIVGGAIVPKLQAILIDHIGIHHAFILPVLCYLYIAYYGVRGSRIIMPT
jgi:MFS transporter, FHS family, L-fucose permease